MITIVIMIGITSLSPFVIRHDDKCGGDENIHDDSDG